MGLIKKKKKIYLNKLTLKKFYNIYGIKKNLLIKGLAYFGYSINPTVLSNNASLIGYSKLLDFLQLKSFTDSDLKYFKVNQIKIHIALKTYKGWRHFYNLPVNGQRTKTNAKTQKRKNLKKKRINKKK